MKKKTSGILVFFLGFMFFISLFVSPANPVEVNWILGVLGAGFMIEGVRRMVIKKA